MAERLTTRFHGILVKEADVSKIQVITKLGQLEDILEKYGVDIQNLDYILEDYSKNQGKDFAICEEMDDLKKDRDTWKRACELASETLKQVMGKPLWIGGNIPTPEVKDSEYFYLQAKNEKENKNNDTDN